MCKCHKRAEWRIVYEIDCEAEQQGWDGDMPLPDYSTWRPYQIIVERICTRCAELSVHDSLGSCWVDVAHAEHQLQCLVKHHGMLPRGVSFDDCTVCLA